MTDRLLRHVRPEQFRELILLLITIGALLFFWTQIPNYFDPRSVNRLTVGFAIPLVVAVGQMMVVLTRNIDLSVSSTVGLTAYVVGTFLTTHETSPWVAAALAMLIGVGLGAINGLLVAYGGVRPSSPRSERWLFIGWSWSKSLVPRRLPRTISPHG